MRNVQTNEEKHFFLITGLLILLLGFSAVWSWGLSSEGPNAAKEFASGELSTRKVASVSATVPTEESAPERVVSRKTSLLDLGCSRKPASVIEVASDLLQLKGQFCGAGNLKLINKTNGYTATLFQNAGKYNTDFIQLKPGKNILSISSGSFSTEIEVQAILSSYN